MPEEAAEITRKCERARSQVREYLKEQTRHVESFCLDLVVNVEQMVAMRPKVNCWLEELHLVDMIKEAHQLTKELDEHNVMYHNKCKEKRKAALKVNGESRVESVKSCLLLQGQTNQVYIDCIHV